MTPARTLFGAEHDAFRSAVREFVERELAPRAEQTRSDRQIGRDLWLAAGKMGFLGFMVPERFGGGGVNDFRFNAVLAEELARLGVAYASSFGINVDVVSPYLLELTTEEQKNRWLPKFCTGELICAIALTEPGTGSDLAAVKTRASWDGSTWHLSGSKTFITNGQGCDLVLVVARTANESTSRSLSIFAVEAGAPGFDRGRKLDKVGQHESDTSELFFTDVEVGPENLIGRLNAGFGYLMNNLRQERLSCAVGALSAARASLEATVEYAKQRHAFGQSIGSMQHLKFSLARAHTEIDVTQAWLDVCVAQHVAGQLDSTDAAKAKLMATDVQNRVLDLCVQVYGGYGYMTEQKVARDWMDARVTRIFAGTNEIMCEVIGRSLGL